jgi:hypothetical protein
MPSAERFNSSIELLDLAPALRERLAAHAGSGESLDAFFSHAVAQPEALAHFMDWTAALANALPARTAEAIALTVASRIGNSDAAARQERAALANGLTSAEVAAIKTGNLGQVDTLSETEGAAAALSRCLLDDFGRRCGPALLRLSRCADRETAVGCLMLATRHIASTTMVNVWTTSAGGGTRDRGSSARR